MTDLTIAVWDGAAAEGQLDDLAEVYSEVYAEPPYSSGPLWAVDAFRARTRNQTGRNGFRLVTARSAGSLVGFSFGLTFPAGGWWSADATPPPAEILAADKYAVIELIVRKPWRGRGIGHRLMDELLAGRPEPWAVLTAVPDAPARKVYARWGWQQMGTAQHTPTAPVMDQLVLGPR